MRNFIFQLIIIASALFAGVSCSKEKVTLYTEAPGIYFNGFSTTYNLRNILKMWKPDVTLSISLSSLPGVRWIKSV